MLVIECDEYLLRKAGITSSLQRARDTRCGVGEFSEKLIQRVADDLKCLFAANQSCNQLPQLDQHLYTIIASVHATRTRCEAGQGLFAVGGLGHGPVGGTTVILHGNSDHGHIVA